jgi:glycerol-3-phosphate acyltransferase PlsY
VVTGLVAAAVVIGHVYPLYLGFRGGKGVATAAGALGALAPGAFGLSLLVFVLVVFWTRFVSLGSILAVSSFPLFVWMLSAVVRSAERDPEFVATATLIPILVLWRHRGNIARLRRGTERRLGGQA